MLTIFRHNPESLNIHSHQYKVGASIITIPQMEKLRHKVAFQNSYSWLRGGSGFKPNRPHWAMLYKTLRVETKSIYCNSHHKLVGRLNCMAWVVWWREDWADGLRMEPVKPGFRKPVPTWASNKEPFRSHLFPVLGNHRIYLEEPGLHLLWSWLGVQSACCYWSHLQLEN